MPRARLTVFELAPAAREIIANVARLNRVTDRTTLLSECTPQNLATTIVQGESTFVLIDVEGAEIELLDPSTIPPLRRDPRHRGGHEYGANARRFSARAPTALATLVPTAGVRGRPRTAQRTAGIHAPDAAQLVRDSRTSTHGCVDPTLRAV